MKSMKKYMGAIVLGGLVLSFPSCSDTWDDHYGAGESTTPATETLWELISSRPELSRFKAIAEKAKFYRDEDHPQDNYTFKDMLQGNMLVTAFVPENSAFTDAEYQDWLTKAETKGYTVHQQLMGNSLTLWRQVATGEGIDTLTMLNGKRMEFDKTQFTMHDLPLVEKNIAAANGTLHTLKSTLPFKYNLYEFLKDADNATTYKVNHFHDYIVAHDTTYFDKVKSIEGNPDADGNPTYVDSVSITTNTMFFQTKRFPEEKNTDRFLVFDESFGANIIAEDSTFITLFPTNTAWEQAYQMLEKYYKYANKYADKEEINKSSGGSDNIAPREVDDTASFKEKNILMDLVSPLCFNLHTQPNEAGKIGRWKLDDFMANSSKATYFMNTYGDTLRTDSAWEKADMLKGQQIRLSNGMAIVTDEWNVPAKLYKPDVIVKINKGSLYKESSFKGSYSAFSFSNEVAKDWIDSVGRISKNEFYYFKPSSESSSAVAEFKLVGNDGENKESEVMSGKYDVYVVMVPNFYLTSKDTINYVTTAGGTAQIVGDSIVPLKHRITATMFYCNGSATGADDNTGKKKAIKDAEVIYEGKKVEEVLLWKDFKFPYSYKNLRHSYPTLQLSTSSNTSERKQGFSNNFCIDRIILRSKD